jgi:hypothetical protein
MNCSSNTSLYPLAPRANGPRMGMARATTTGTFFAVGQKQRGNYMKRKPLDGFARFPDSPL